MGYIIKIPTTGPIEIDTKKLSFKDAQKYVEGYVQPVYGTMTPELLATALIHVGDESMAPLAEIFDKPIEVKWAVNEDGEMKRKPVNPRATVLMNLGYEILGNVVLYVGYDF
jgi:hypothetical protein